MTPAQRRQLYRVYYNSKHPAGFGSIQKLIDATRLDPPIVKAWLEEQPTYTFHKPKAVRLKAHYPYRVYVPRLQYQSDLVDYSKYADANRGYKFMLVVIDVFTKMAWAAPLKTKSGKEVAAALKPILNPPPKRLQVDQGSEFHNKDVKAMLRKKGVELFSIYSQFKAAVVERLNRTIKDKLEKILTGTNTKNWVDHLDAVIKTYNETPHRSIGMAPNDVNEDNLDEAVTALLKSQRQNQKKQKEKALPINTRVRISREKGPFGKGYEANWSVEEYFIESARKTPGGPYMYRLRDYKGDILKGSFYGKELQPVRRREETFQIDAILGERTRNKKKEVLVHWQGYPASMNEWIPASRLQKLPKFRKH